MLDLEVFWLPVCISTFTPSGSNHFEKFRKCCSARISVGAISATLKPLSNAINALHAATAVLPEPTSPCNKTPHRMRAAHVRADFAQHFRLRFRQFETEFREKRFHQTIVAAARQRFGKRLEFFPARLDLKLQRHKFIHRQPLPRDFHVGQFFGKMNHANGIGTGRQIGRAFGEHAIFDAATRQFRSPVPRFHFQIFPARARRACASRAPSGRRSADGSARCG